jgi:hypothetical protein
MSSINPQDVKTLRDVRTLLNEVDNKIDEIKDDMLHEVGVIEKAIFKIRRGLGSPNDEKQINLACQELRNLLIEDNRTL